MVSGVRACEVVEGRRNGGRRPELLDYGLQESFALRFLWLRKLPSFLRSFASVAVFVSRCVSRLNLVCSYSDSYDD